jgi:uncharacterized protein DUF6980
MLGEAPHHCETMSLALANPEYPIDYDDVVRAYNLRILDGGSSYLALVYCPFCGAKLPGRLGEEWFDRLEARGIEPGSPEVPAEMRDGSWWRLSNVPYEVGDPSPYETS